MRTLVIETATSACSVALIEQGKVVASTHDVVGRGHAEWLVPMIAGLPDGGRAAHILVDCGPGSFTGIRVGIAAARGLALGWGASVSGYSSLSLLAAAAFAEGVGSDLAVVLEGGHGEVFMQGFAAPASPVGSFVSLRPEAALAALAGRMAVGNGVRFLTALDPDAAVQERLPDAAHAVFLPADRATLDAKPIYGRAPDAKPQSLAAHPLSTVVGIDLRQGVATDVDLVDRIMQAAFDPRFGEAWTRNQVLGLMAMPGVWLTIAHVGGEPAGFALSRRVLDEAELLLLATDPRFRRRGVAAALLRSVMSDARSQGARTLHLEVRQGNDAIKLYTSSGFVKVGQRRDYYCVAGGQSFDALTYRRELS